MTRHTRSRAQRFYGVDRRNFIHYVAAVSAIPSFAAVADELSGKNHEFADYPFTLGVASGDPEPDGVVIWTRLAPSPLTGDGLPPIPIATQWEVATDESFTNIVRSGTTNATPQLGHSVHVEVTGLKPYRWYFYRFHVGKQTSPTGRTRTAPDLQATPDQIRFAFTSCQHYESGYFNGYPHMQQEDLDLVVHLGDYIYEYGGQDNRPRKHIGNEIETLQDYRTRYS